MAVVLVLPVGHRQQHVAIVQGSSKVVRGGGDALGCSQFDAKRQAADQLDDPFRIGRVGRRAVDSLRESVGEETASVGEPRVLSGVESEGPENEMLPPGYVQCHPARGDHVDGRCIGGDPLHERCCVGTEMLAVVENQQCPSASQACQHHGFHAACRGNAEIHR